MYTPRSGAFRKVKYGLRIYRDEEIPENDLDEVLKISKLIKDDVEKTSDKGRVSSENAKEQTKLLRENRGGENFRGDKPDIQVYPKTSNNHVGVFKIPEKLYDEYYPENVKIPDFPFPIKSHAGAGCLKEALDDDTSDYDMDSDDEEWLQKHPEYHITPSRLEYIFAQLNKRNTHVQEKALGALRTPYHKDFNRIFPYWKEKRCQNRNVSNFKPKQNCSKKDMKYFGTDPYLAFLVNPEKTVSAPTTPRHQKSFQKSDVDGRAVSSFLAKISERKNDLIRFRDWAKGEMRKGEIKRDAIVNGIINLDERYNDLKNNLGHHNMKVDQCRNKTSADCTYHPYNSPSSSKYLSTRQSVRQMRDLPLYFCNNDMFSSSKSTRFRELFNDASKSHVNCKSSFTGIRKTKRNLHKKSGPKRILNDSTFELTIGESYEQCRAG